MNIAIVGTGRMARQRVAALLRMEDVSITAIHSRSRERATRFLEEMGLEGTKFATWSELLDDNDLDGIVVAGPNSDHEPKAIDTLSCGKSLFLEYPPACTVEGVNRIAELGSISGKSIHVGLTHRYGPAHEGKKTLFSTAGELGRPISYQRTICTGNPISRWYNDDSLSGGMFVGSLYHYLDESISIFGSVSASTSNYWVERGNEGLITRDRGAVSLQHDTGTVSQIVYARGMSAPGIGSRGVGVFEKGYLVEKADSIFMLSPDGKREVTWPKGDAMYDDTRAFIDLMISARPADGSLDAARESLDLALSLKNTAVEG